jgi:hypothetical protein
MLSAEDRTTLIWLRFHWGEEYAVNLQGSIWTAVPLSDPWLLSEPTPARLRAAMVLDAASRRIRSGATAARWASFITPTPEDRRELPGGCA